MASALNDTVRELGGAVGIALLGSLVSAGYRSSVAGATTELSPDVARHVQEGIGSAFAAAATSGPRRRRSSMPPATRSSTGWRLSMWVGVALAAVALVFLVVRGPRPADSLAEDMLYDEFDQLGELDVVSV